MTAATAAVKDRHGGAVGIAVRSARRLLNVLAVGVASARALGVAVVAPERRVVELEPLAADPNLRLDESVFAGDEWMSWAEENLEPRELELMRLADAADRDQVRAASLC